MIVLDTHVWIWWTLETERLSAAQKRVIEDNEGDLIGVSAIIVATARVHACDLVTSDEKIVKYPHVRTIA